MIHWTWLGCCSFVIWLDFFSYYRCHNTCSLCFHSLCQVEETHREHVQLVNDAHVHVDYTTERVKQVKITQFEVGSWQVANFDGLYFVGQICHGELNGTLLVNYLHQVVCRLNRCIWFTPEGCYATSLEDISMPVMEAPCPTGAWNERSFRLIDMTSHKMVGVRHRSLTR